MLKRSLSLFLVFCTVLVLLTGCAGSQQSSNPTIQETKNGEYILTTENGIITMFDNVSNVLAEVDLNAGEDSKYIYTMDEGNIYSSKLTDVDNIPRILYAVDKSSRKMTMILVYKNELKMMKDYILQEGEIEDIYGYNGVFFYSTRNKDTKANYYTYVRPQILSDDGKLSYATNIPVNTSKDSLYVYMENYTSDFLNYTGLNKYISSIDKELMNIPKVNKATYALPGDTSTWVANTQNIYFFSKVQMGSYDMENNRITLHYGTIRPISATYIDGINKDIYTISDFGDGSEKSLILNVDYDDMIVNKAIEIQYANPLNIFVDKDKNIYALFKTTTSEKNFSQLRIFRYGDYAELYTIGVPYLPTKVLSKDSEIYLFNPYEDYFLIGAIGSSDFSEVKKSATDENRKYTDIFLANRPYINDYYYDDDGRLVNRENFFINSDGELVDENNDRINKYGQRIDEKGRAINKAGEFIDKYNNIIDEKGNVIKYIQNKDGNYYNSKGQLVDSDGTVLVRNEIGDYVRPEVLIEEQGGIQITGHYDEYGNFIIDKDVLEKYPDAYTIWQEQKNANK